jgi:hypothetical protein
MSISRSIDDIVVEVGRSFVLSDSGNGRRPSA